MAANSLRVIVSDLLFPAVGASGVMRAFGATSFTVVLVPWILEESVPTWEGLLEMCDVESPEKRVRKITAGMLQKYASSYRSHFEWWRDFIRRRHGVMARVGGSLPLAGALREECLATGALESCL